MRSFLKHPEILLVWYIFLKSPSDAAYIQYGNSAWISGIPWPICYFIKRLKNQYTARVIQVNIFSR